MAVTDSGGSHMQRGNICFASRHLWLVVARWACKGLREDNDGLVVLALCHDDVTVHTFI